MKAEAAFIGFLIVLLSVSVAANHNQSYASCSGGFELNSSNPTVNSDGGAFVRVENRNRPLKLVADLTKDGSFSPEWDQTVLTWPVLEGECWSVGAFRYLPEREGNFTVYATEELEPYMNLAGLPSVEISIENDAPELVSESFTRDKLNMTYRFRTDEKLAESMFVRVNLNSSEEDNIFYRKFLGEDVKREGNNTYSVNFKAQRPGRYSVDVEQSWDIYGNFRKFNYTKDFVVNNVLGSISDAKPKNGSFLPSGADITVEFEDNQGFNYTEDSFNISFKNSKTYRKVPENSYSFDGRELRIESGEIKSSNSRGTVEFRITAQGRYGASPDMHLQYDLVEGPLANSLYFPKHYRRVLS